MVSASHLEDYGKDTFEPEELIQSDSDYKLKLNYSSGYAF